MNDIVVTLIVVALGYETGLAGPGEVVERATPLFSHGRVYWHLCSLSIVMRVRNQLTPCVRRTQSDTGHGVLTSPWLRWVERTI